MLALAGIHCQEKRKRKTLACFQPGEGGEEKAAQTPPAPALPLLLPGKNKQLTFTSPPFPAFSDFWSLLPAHLLCSLCGSDCTHLPLTFSLLSLPARLDCLAGLKYVLPVPHTTMKEKRPRKRKGTLLSIKSDIFFLLHCFWEEDTHACAVCLYAEWRQAPPCLTSLTCLALHASQEA